MEETKSAAPEGAALTRRELQGYLKIWGKRAIGRTEALRKSYDAARLKIAEKYGNEEPSEDRAEQAKTAGAAKSTRKRKKEAKETEEKRVKRFRSHCPIPIRERIARAKSQRLYLVRRDEVIDNECKFVVLGSTGNIYQVNIGQIPHCDCPDHAKGNLCKHILFVLLKVMRIDSESHLMYQAAFLQKELTEMFETMNSRRAGGAIMANSRVQATYASLQEGKSMEGTEKVDGGEEVIQRKSLDADSDCPICFDEMIKGSGLTYCLAACGTNFHSDCIRRWCSQQQGNATCPNCRQPWLDAKGCRKKRYDEGYTNLGRLQGQSTVRDTSTYNRRG